jgi:hypothetical protein
VVERSGTTSSAALLLGPHYDALFFSYHLS